MADQQLQSLRLPSQAAALPINRRLRVLIDMVGMYSPEWGGMQEHVLILSRHLSQLGHAPALIPHVSYPARIRERFEAEGIRWIEDPQLMASDGAFPSVRQWMPALRALLLREHIDIYHIHSALMGSEIWAVLVARSIGRAPVMTYHLPPRSLPESYQRQLGMFAIHHILHPRVIAVSSDVYTAIRHCYHPPRSQLFRVGNGIDDLPPLSPAALPLALTRRAASEVIVGVIARLVPQKGLDTLLAALALVDARLPLRVLIIGSGDQDATLKRQMELLRLGGRVEFLGFMADAGHLAPFFDLVLIPSRVEGLPLTALEAFAAGRPVLATCVGGLPEIITDGDTGWLVPPDDPPALARALEAAIRDPLARQRIGIAARRRFEQDLSAATMTQKTLQVYDAALGVHT